ncbi:MAG: MGH1-like glycoside hydrolase domain-containing protein, partial [Actinomycetota bacterium]
DDVWRQTRVRLDPPPDEVLPHEGRVTARWNVTLEPRGAARLRLAVEPLIGDDAPVDGGMAEAAARIERDERRWRDSSTRFAVDDRALDRVLQTSLNDARALMTPMDDGRIPAAGVPWFVCPFGRDSLIASYGLLSLATGPARETLLLLAARQATEDDPERDAEPGKILHELRYGELARAGYVPHRPYYGTADATPLFLIVAAAYHRWTADLKTMARLRPHFDAALAWIDEHGDRDGDGFVEYLRRAPRGGLQNQGWKDSATSMVHADGALAEGPIALCEVQAYVYAAKRAIADVYGALGERETAARLRGEAQRLRSAFHEAFWMPEEGTFALALDGSKRQLKSVTSNAGHCLFAGIVDADRAAAVVERSMAEDMFTGWGIRTLASTSASYDPTSYHNGSVWPHDSAMVAAGFKSYGFDAEARTVGAALLDAAAAADDLRLPELYSGLPRTGKRPERYAAACRPQAWAAVTPFFLLQTLLGIEADAPAGHLRIERPRLPERLGSVGVENLGVGPGRVHLRFESRGEATTVVESRAEGPVTVEILEPPAPA